MTDDAPATTAKRPIGLVVATVYYALIGFGMFGVMAWLPDSGLLDGAFDKMFAGLTYWDGISNAYLSRFGVFHLIPAAVCAILLALRDARAFWFAAVVAIRAAIKIVIMVAMVLAGHALWRPAAGVCALAAIEILLAWRIYAWRKRRVLK